MSIALYQVRLYWDGRRGTARHGDDMRELCQAPVLPGSEDVELEEIDYAPEVALAQVREHDHDWRPMTDAEVAAAEALLATLHTGPATKH